VRIETVWIDVNRPSTVLIGFRSAAQLNQAVTEIVVKPVALVAVNGFQPQGFAVCRGSIGKLAQPLAKHTEVTELLGLVRQVRGAVGKGSQILGRDIATMRVVAALGSMMDGLADDSLLFVGSLGKKECPCLRHVSKVNDRDLPTRQTKTHQPYQNQASHR